MAETNRQVFQKHAQNEFRFLVEAYGFVQVSSEPNRVRFTSNHVIVDVCYSTRNELDVILDENPPSCRFQLWLYLQEYHPGFTPPPKYGIAYSDDEVRVGLNHMADALQRHGKPLLDHDQQVFERMKSFRPGLRNS